MCLLKMCVIEGLINQLPTANYNTYSCGGVEDKQRQGGGGGSVNVATNLALCML